MSHQPPQKQNDNLNPLRSALEVISLYLLIGFSWILFSDIVLSWFVNDPTLFERIQTIKGTFYVITSALLFYWIIKRRMDYYHEAIHQQNLMTNDLKKSYDELAGLERELHQRAFVDSLTGFHSKIAIQQLIENQIRQHPHQVFGLVYLDIDNFRHINELKGHVVGDDLIRLIAKEISLIAPAPHEIGRISGDEFLVFLRGLDDKKEVISIVNQNSGRIHKQFKLAGDDFYVSVSAGVVIYPDDGDSFELLFRHADMALNIAKQNGRNQITMFEEVFKSTFKSHIELSNALYQAIPNKELTVHFQPIIDIQQNCIYAVEALLRWRHPSRGNVSPSQFIPLAEMSGQIKDLTMFVIEQCFIQSKLWASRNNCFLVSINISTKVLNDVNFVDDVKNIVEHYQIKPENFIMEITESIVMDQFEETTKVLERLHRIGFSIAMDDFGTGYSSLTYLQRLPLQVLKIDRSFISQMSDKKSDLPLMKFMVDLGHLLGLKVIVEGVEQDFQLEKLKTYAVDYVQGYYFAKPGPAAEITEFFESCKENCHPS